MAQTNRHTEHPWPFYTGVASQADCGRRLVNLWPHFAYQNGMRSQKPFRMTSLRQIHLQPSWNDILAKNIGGGGYVLFDNCPILRSPAAPGADPKFFAARHFAPHIEHTL